MTKDLQSILASQVIGLCLPTEDNFGYGYVGEYTEWSNELVDHKGKDRVS